MAVGPVHLEGLLRKPNYRQAKNAREAAKSKAQAEKLARRQAARALKSPDDLADQAEPAAPAAPADSSSS
jgi:hypothetical protein